MISASDEFVMDSHPLSFQFDDVEVRPQSFEVLKAGVALALEPKSIRVLVCLIENRHRAVSKDELFQAVWAGTNVTDNALTRVVAQLRRELGDDARQPRYIQTVPTLGYRFVAQVRTSGGDAAPVTPARRPRSAMLTAAAAVAALAAILWLSLRTPGQSAWAGSLQVRSIAQVTTSPAFDNSPSFSPDGQSMVYASDRSGRFEIYLRTLRGGNPEKQLTADGLQNVQPVWSPEGKTIAYHCAAKGGIWTVPATGGPGRQLAPVGSQPAWSPDSKLLAYRGEDLTSLSPPDLTFTGKSAIYVVPAAGGLARRLTAPRPGGWHVFPSWSPDGSRVLYAAYSGNLGELWTVGTDGSAAARIGSLPAAIYLCPVFSRRGDRILYSSYSPTREFGLWQVRLKPSGNAADGQPVPLTRSGPLMPRDLALSPDGRRLAYSSSETNGTLWKLPMDTAGNPSGPPAPLYSEVVFRATMPAFSPDGSHLAFFSRLFGGQANIWLMNADGTGAAQFAEGPGLEMMASWSPDSKSVIFTRRSPAGVQLLRKAITGGAESPLLSNHPVPGWPRISPDGTEIAFHQTRNGVMNVWIGSLATGAIRQLTHDLQGAGFPAWSPDGRILTYELTRGGNSYLAVIGRDGAGATQINADAVHNWCYSWSPDGRRILFAGYRQGTWNLWWIDRETREQHQLTGYESLAGFVRYPVWSPKGDRIVFERSLTRGNIYVLDLE